MKKIQQLRESDNAFQLNRELPRFRTWYNYELTEKDKEEVSDEVVTIPGQSLTVREILERYTKGQPVDIVEHQGQFTDTDDFDDFDPLTTPERDMVDIELALSETRAKIAKNADQAGSRSAKKEGLGEKTKEADITEAESKKPGQASPKHAKDEASQADTLTA